VPVRLIAGSGSRPAGVERRPIARSSLGAGTCSVASDRLARVFSSTGAVEHRGRIRLSPARDQMPASSRWRKTKGGRGLVAQYSDVVQDTGSTIFSKRSEGQGT